MKALLILGLATAVFAWPPSSDHHRDDGRIPELLLVDTLGNGFDLAGIRSGVKFRFGNQPPEPTGWTRANGDDAFVAIDFSGDGRISDATELVGGGIGPPDGFAFLGLRSPGEDGLPPLEVITKQDRVFKSLILWNDISADGNSAELELQSFAFAGFESIRLPRALTVSTDSWGNVFRKRGTVVRRSGNAVSSVPIASVRLVAQ